MDIIKPITSFKQANAYLTRFHESSAAEYNLDNMHQLMADLGNPQNRFKTVHVAGTSGKTSTVYYMTALLTAAGCKVGTTVSPHVDQTNERVQIDGQPLAEELFCQALTEFLEVAGKSSVQPSWFEIMVAFAYWYFARQQVDYAVVEVGLGGRLDGTNVISRSDKVCVVTDIGYDHMPILGNNLEEIATQKLGIVHDGNPLFMYRQADEVTWVAEAVARERQAELHLLQEPDLRAALSQDIAFMPEYQQRNWLLAYRVYQYIQAKDELPQLADQALQQAQTIHIPGRMDIRQAGDKKLVMDGAHNVQKIEAFVASFAKLFPGAKPAILIGMREGKEAEKVAPVLAPLAGRIITTAFVSSQDLPISSMDSEALAQAFRAAGAKDVESVADLTQATKTLLSSPETVCIITGSIYLLGQIRNNNLI